jgi:hypothetical protein
VIRGAFGDVGESDLAPGVHEEHATELAAGSFARFVPVPLEHDFDNLQEHPWGVVITPVHVSQAVLLEEQTLRVTNDGKRHFEVVAEGFGLVRRPGTKPDPTLTATRLCVPA